MYVWIYTQKGNLDQYDNAKKYVFQKIWSGKKNLQGQKPLISHRKCDENLHKLKLWVCVWEKYETIMLWK